MRSKQETTWIFLKNKLLKWRMSRLIYDFHFRIPYYILYYICLLYILYIDNILFRFIVLDMNYPHLYLSELYIRAINDSDSNRAALNQMKITLTLYEVTIQESKITSYPAKIPQTKQKISSGLTRSFVAHFEGLNAIFGKFCQFWFEILPILILNFWFQIFHNFERGKIHQGVNKGFWGETFVFVNFDDQGGKKMDHKKLFWGIFAKNRVSPLFCATKPRIGSFGAANSPNPTQFLSIFELKIFSRQFRKTVKPIDPTNLSDFAKISDILEFIKLK